MTDEQLWLPFDEEVGIVQQVGPWLPHFENPETDNERLLEYQYQFRVNGRRDALAAFYQLGCEICEKYISAETRRNRHIKKLSIDERREKASDATNYIISQYLKKANWHISKSATAYLYLRVQHELYYRTKAQQLVDFVNFDDFYKLGEEDDMEWEEE